MLRLHSLNKDQADDRIRLSCIVDSDAGRRSLWFSLPPALADHVEGRVFDPFVIGLLFEASQSGQDIVIEGKISERLHYGIANGYAYLLSRLTEAGQPIRLLPDDIAGLNATEGHVAAGFSAGIDSFQTYIDHNAESVAPTFRISCFLMNNVGSHGGSDQADIVFARRRDNVRAFADETGIRLIDINSNLADLYLNTPFS